MPTSSSHFYIARGVSRRRRRELWQRLRERERERERDPVVATLKRKREKGKGLLLLENFNGAHRKKKRFDDRLFVSNFTKALSVASNARLLRRKGVDKRSRFTAPPTVPTVLDDESAVVVARSLFLSRRHSKGFWKGRGGRGPEALSSRNHRPLPLFAFVQKKADSKRPVHGKGRDF